VVYISCSSVYFIYSTYIEDYIIEKENKEKQITEAKFEALSNQMNPTLFFNALNSIQDYVGANDEYNSLYILVNLQG
jgi:LytS/YehU family sensor histidine kinase